jgi:deoxyribodipyrimidine photolyase-related protein
MAEVHEEATYVRHHKKKIAFLFSAMRHFAEELRADGWRVEYRRLDDEDNRGSFTGEVGRAIERRRPECVIVTEPGEWRVRAAMEGWAESFGLPVVIRQDSRFICGVGEFADWARGRKQLRMEYFYREMRRKTGLLMDGGEPEGGRWNFDQENRKAAKPDLFMPRPRQVKPDAVTREVLDLVAARFGGHFGDLEPFWFATTRRDAEAAFEHFIEASLASFGDFQDAMLTGERFLFHSVIALYLNCGLLDPLAVCRRVERAYRDGKAPLNAAEGFIRQVIGWREYVRGIYWLNMPGYAERNFFGHGRPVPDFYWTGETDMACLRAAITQTKEEAYAHHIQRLMVTGNFALLAGIDPRALHEWYLTVYADAYEWVELPNTLGMSQFADGGLLASKPYAASGAYINRMSDHCKSCRHDVKQRTGGDACPFNALYWDFLARNREKLAGNPRMGQIYRTYDRFPDAEKQRIAASADRTKASLEGAGEGDG